MTAYSTHPWELVKLRDICSSKEPCDPTRDPDSEFVYVDIASVCNQRFKIANARTVVGREAPSRARKRVRTGDVLVATTRPYLRTVARVPEELDGQVCSTGFCVLRPKAQVLTDWIFFVALSADFIDQLSRRMRGATYPAVSDRDVLDVEIPVPSLTEQRRIVARIKECMERVAEIMDLRLDISRSNRALRYSCVTDVVEQLKSTYPRERLGNLLAGKTDAMRSGPFGSAMKHNEFVPDGNLVIGIANVQQNWFDPVRKWMITDHKYQQMLRYAVEPGDVLITIMGTIGRTCVVPEDIGRAITSKHVYRIRFPKERVVPEYVSHILNFDHEVRFQLYGTATGGVMPGLNSTKLKNLEICIPPLEVQQDVVSKLDAMHSGLSRTESLRAGEEFVRLREAILRSALNGEL